MITKKEYKKDNNLRIWTLTAFEFFFPSIQCNIFMKSQLKCIIWLPTNSKGKPKTHLDQIMPLYKTNEIKCPKMQCKCTKSIPTCH
jgi:hypothetical protein